MKRSIIAAVMAAALALVGCGQKTASDKPADTFEEVTTAPLIGDFVDDFSYYTGTFNSEVFKHIIGNISIGGAKITMPCTFAELPSGAALHEQSIVDAESSIASYILLYNGSNVGTIEYHMDRKLTEDELRTIPFFYLYLKQPAETDIKICAAGASIGEPFDMVIKNLGEPDENTVNSDGIGFMTYKNENGDELEFYIKNNKIKKITILLAEGW